MDFKFIHAADIHLDSPLQGLGRYEGAPAEYARGAGRVAFQNMVKEALQESVDFVLIAGDLYDGDWRDYNTGLFFVAQAARLREAGIKVFIVRGNHDAASQITRLLRLPDNVRDFSTEDPETVLLDELGVAVHGQGFPTPAFTEDISRRYPEPIQGYFNIGLLHTCVSGRAGHANYAPCDTGYLKNKGYDYWALGHVHRNEVISEDPWIVFPGNIQGRHIREEGAKGCVFVEVRDGRVKTAEHRALDVLRWHLCRVDAGGLRIYDEVLEQAGKNLDRVLAQSEGRLLALRVIISGFCAIHNKLLREHSRLYSDLCALAAERGLDSIWVEKVKIDTRYPHRTEDLSAGTPIASLLQYTREFSRDKRFMQEITRELARDKNALPADLFRDGEMNLEDAGYLRELLAGAEELIFARLEERERVFGED